jgi:hypothetical protein
VSNGHYLDFDQLSRLMIAISEAGGEELSEKGLAEETGMPRRQVQNRISIARAAGLLQRRSYVHSHFGSLVIRHDPFFDNRGTLETIHYLAASEYANLVWYEVFNSILVGQRVLDSGEIRAQFRQSLKNQYSQHSLDDHLQKEVRFIVNAYTEQKLRSLELLLQDEEGALKRGRHLQLDSRIAAALIYRFGEQQQRQVWGIEEMVSEKGSPGLLFGFDLGPMRRLAEELHGKRWLRYETTHGLDQVRLIPGMTFLEFLSAYYEGREPADDV